MQNLIIVPSSAAIRCSEKKAISRPTSEVILEKSHSNVTLRGARNSSQLKVILKITRDAIKSKKHIPLY